MVSNLGLVKQKRVIKLKLTQAMLY